MLLNLIPTLALVVAGIPFPQSPPVDDSSKLLNPREEKGASIAHLARISRTLHAIPGTEANTYYMAALLEPGLHGDSMRNVVARLAVDQQGVGKAEIVYSEHFQAPSARAVVVGVCGEREHVVIVRVAGGPQ